MAGNYTVTVSDVNACTSTGSVTILQSPQILANLTVSSNYNGQDISCFGSTDGELTSSPTGGDGSYSYLWSNGSTTNIVSGLGRVYII